MSRLFGLSSVVALSLLATPALASSWSIDGAKSSLGFTGSQSGSAFSGKFARWDGKIDFDPANPAAGHALISIDMASAVTGDKQKDESLPQSDWFDIKSFPKAVFEATSFRAKGGNAYEAVGKLTIRNQSKDVVLPFTLDIAGDQAHAKGKLDILRTDYGVGQGSWKAPDFVALEVGVTFDLTAARQK